MRHPRPMGLTLPAVSCIAAGGCGEFIRLSALRGRLPWQGESLIAPLSNFNGRATRSFSNPRRWTQMGRRRREKAGYRMADGKFPPSPEETISRSPEPNLAVVKTHQPPGALPEGPHSPARSTCYPRPCAPCERG